jgi:hypothetical protein
MKSYMQFKCLCNALTRERLPNNLLHATSDSAETELNSFETRSDQ